MQPAFIVRFRPSGPWRIGPDSGARDRVDRVFHSDSFFSALTLAMRDLGRMEEWLDATARNPEGPAVRLSSLFPLFEEIHFVAPPRNLWPRPASAKIRWNGARFIPLSLVADLVDEHWPHENRWVVDGESECLLPADLRSSAPGPFRTVIRSRAAVDRRSGSVQPHGAACLEFAPGGGLWALVAFSSEEDAGRWSEPVRAALRLLADSGMGGERSLGWGRSEQPEFFDGELGDLILAARPATDDRPGIETAWWLLSLYAPAAADTVEWHRGNYALVTRGGRIESRAGWGAEKKLLRMVSEGSVLFAGAPPRGAAPDVAPDGFPHPVFRSGLALAVPIPAASGGA